MIRPQQIDDAISRIEYHHFRGTTQTACCLTLHNGYSVVGLSSAADPDEFDVDLGKQFARVDADSKVASLLAFVEREIKSSASEH